MLIGAGGDRVYVVEEEHRRRDVLSPYLVWIPPRVTFVERWAVPAVPAP